MANQMKIGIIDYGVGNLGSVYEALDELGVDPCLVDRPSDIHSVDKLVLPGVGGFKSCKTLLDDFGWTRAIQEEVLGFNKPILGICLGMQLLASFGAEGAAEDEFTEGLDLIPGKVVNLEALGCKERVPHVGWDDVTPCVSSHNLMRGIPDGTDFYFVHSYAFIPDNPDVISASCYYGSVDIAAAVSQQNICGTQFHPEKSSKAGYKLLQNFIDGNQC
jgi:glutamine amidotransferase